MEFPSRRRQISIPYQRRQPPLEAWVTYVHYCCCGPSYLASYIHPRRPSAVRRRLTLDTPSFYSRTTSRSATARGPDVFVPETPTRERENHYWGPGQVLPAAYPSSCDAEPALQIEQGDSDVKSLLQELQNSVDANFQQIKKKLCDLEGRVEKVEEKQVELQNSPSSSECNSSSSPSNTC